MSTIAVVIPAYNAADYIAQALTSVAAQTRRPDELVVVDDGSTDGTAEVVLHWTRVTGVPVTLRQQENRGLPGARNTAIRRTSADLIALLDADDVFLPHHLALVSRALTENADVVLGFADGESFDSTGVLSQSLLAGTRLHHLRYDLGPDGLRILRGSVYESLLWGNYVPVGSTVFRRDAADKVGLFDEAFRFAEDREFYLRLSRVGRFGYYPQVVHRKRVHGENITHAKNRERFRRWQLLVLQKMLRIAQELGLSRDEILATEQALGEQAWIMLYHASERGIGAYLDMLGFLWGRKIRAPVLNPKHWARAVAFSTVREKRFR